MAMSQEALQTAVSKAMFAPEEAPFYQQDKVSWSPAPKFYGAGAGGGLFLAGLEALEEVFTLTIGPKLTMFLGMLSTLVGLYIVPDPDRKVRENV